MLVSYAEGAVLGLRRSWSMPLTPRGVEWGRGYGDGGIAEAYPVQERGMASYATRG